MFDIGDRVVCINDEPSLYLGALIHPAIKKHQIYTVIDCFPEGTGRVLGNVDWRFDCDYIAVGVDFIMGADAWPCIRFRKVLDIEDFAALETSVDLPVRELEGV